MTALTRHIDRLADVADSLTSAHQVLEECRGWLAGYEEPEGASSPSYLLSAIDTPTALSIGRVEGSLELAINAARAAEHLIRLLEPRLRGEQVPS